MVTRKSCFKSTRKTFYPVWIFYVLLIVNPAYVLAQDDSEKGLPFITNYSPKVFNAAPQTWCIIEDNRGIMYFGSQANILEYDGVRWKKVLFKTTKPPVVRSFAKDKNGRIYYGGIADFGYLVHDSLGQTTGVSLINFVPKDRRNFFDVWTIHIAGDDIFFQSREYIFRLDKQNKITSWAPKSKFMYAFYYDDTYYVHEQGVGLLKLNKDSLELIPGSEFLGQERMQLMLPYSNADENNNESSHQYLVGLFYSGLFLFDGKTFHPFKTEADELIKSGTLYKGAKMSGERYALSTTGKGIAIINRQGKIIQLINRDIGLQDESVYGVYFDSKGTLWLALDNGISRVDISSPLTQFTNQSGINTATLSLIRFDGKLYLGTTNGLKKYNEETTKFETITGIPPNQTFSLLPDGNSLLIPNDGLFETKNNKINLIRPSIGGDMQLSGLKISHKYPNILFGGATFGVAVFYKEKGTGAWQFKGHIPRLNDQFWTFAENADGSIWGGTQNAVVYHIFPALDEKGEPDLNKFSFKKYGEDQGLKNGLGAVFSLKGQTWFVGDSTLYKFDYKQDHFFPDSTFGHFNMGGGRDEFDMVADNKGRIWLRFGKEAMLATPQADGKYHIDKTPLLPIADRTFSRFYPDENGILWICTTDGLVRYDENLEKNYDQPFKTLLRNITAGQLTLDLGIEKNDKKNNAVAFKDNSLRFEYAAPFFEQEDKTRYQTWLEGFEDGWSDWGNNYYKEYTNIPHGDYKFHVRAMNIYQKVSEEAVYDFTINPPWFQTWWAYLVYAIIAAVIIYMIVRWRTRQFHEKHRELEKTVADRTKELSHRLQELAIINSVQEGLASKLDMQAVYELVGEKIREIFKAQVIDIVAYNKVANTIEDCYTYEKGDRTLLGPRQLKGFKKHVIETARPLLINKDVVHERVKYDNTVIVGDGAKSLVLVPMIAGKEVTGVISLQNLDIENAFTDSDVNLLTTLANSMSVALESAKRFDETNRLLKETEQRTAELAVINSVQEGLAKELDIRGIYELVGDRLCSLFPDTQTLVIRTFDHETGLENWQYAKEKGERQYVASRPFNWNSKLLIQTKRHLNIAEDYVATAQSYGSSRVTAGRPPKSAVFVPMIVGDTVKGTVSLQNVDRENAFTDSDLRLLTTITNSMSVALENARLFDETNRLLKETEQRKAELALINSVQEGLVREMDIQGIYDLVGDRVQKLFNAQTVLIASFNFVNNTEQFNYAFENNERLWFESRPINKLRQLLIDQKETIYIETEEKARNQYGITAIEDSDMPKSLLFVPLLSGNDIKGYVSLQNIDTEHAFTQSDIHLLETLIYSMSVALENARLFAETKLLLAETEKGKKNVELLSEIGKQITASLDFETIFYKLYEHINQLADASVFGVGIYNPDKQQIEVNFAIEKGKRYAPYTRDTNDKNQFPVWCLENRKPVFINDVETEYSKYISQYKETKRLLEDGTVSAQPISLIYLPLIVKDTLLGIITIQSFKKNAYSEYQLNLVQNLATYTSIALDNASAYRQLNEREQVIAQRAAELYTVNSITNAMAAKLDPDELIKLVGDQLKDLFKANIVYMAILDKKTCIINFPYQRGDNMPPMKLGEGLTSQILLTGKPLLINKDVEESASRLGRSHVGIPAASYIGVPVPVGDEIIGVLSVQSTETENRFNENDQRLLSTIAISVGVAFNNAKLFDEVQHAQLEAETARKSAEKANEAKSSFLSTVSHELRTPLTSVLGFAKIIRKRLEEKIFPFTNRTDAKTEKSIQQVSENLGVVISEGERLTTLINDVLDLAKIEAGKMEWNMDYVSAAEIAERAVAATTSLFEQKNLKLEKYIEPGLPSIRADRDKLIQVVVNLISNAVKFTNAGIVTCRVYKQGNEIITAISDTGIGIDSKDYAAVFEQFRQVGGDTLTDKPKGTGLGLPICKEIVEHHGGRIWLESEVGKGSTFAFAIPVIKTEASVKPIHLNDLVKQLKHQMAQSKLNTNGKSTTILVVDDEDSIRSLLRQELSDAGYHIEEAANGKEALERIRIIKPDLIILDVMMPEMNGFDVAAILKNDPQTMDIPIIVLSIVQDKARGYRIGVDRYLTKPIDTTELFAEVGTLLGQGKSKKKVLVVDEDSAAVRSLTEVLQTKGYHVFEADGKELLEKAVSTQPDIIILNSLYSDKQQIVQSLRFEKGLENVLFLIYQ